MHCATAVVHTNIGMLTKSCRLNKSEAARSCARFRNRRRASTRLAPQQKGGAGIPAGRSIAAHCAYRSTYIHREYSSIHRSYGRSGCPPRPGFLVSGHRSGICRNTVQQPIIHKHFIRRRALFFSRSRGLNNLFFPRRFLVVGPPVVWEKETRVNGRKQYQV